ncbi:MAG: hypothetical protein AB1426_11925 [Bacillota bacterium]
MLITFSERVITPDCYTGPAQNFIYILCDPELVALKIFAAPEVLVAAEDFGIKPGTVFTEASCGTNALALAREHNRLVAIRETALLRTVQRLVVRRRPGNKS